MKYTLAGFIGIININDNCNIIWEGMSSYSPFMMSIIKSLNDIANNLSI